MVRYGAMRRREVGKETLTPENMSARNRASALSTCPILYGFTIYCIPIQFLTRPPSHLANHISSFLAMAFERDFHPGAEFTTFT